MPRTARTPEANAKMTKKTIDTKGTKKTTARGQKSDISIARTMGVMEILTLLPDSPQLLSQYGLSCFSCSMNASETLEDGCLSHGFQSEDIDDLVTDLNEMLKDRPDRPQTLTLTESAARALLQIMEGQNKTDEGLLVGLDENGGFCMEFQKRAKRDDKIFQNDTVPGVKIFATLMTLAGIGGSTIDFRDGRFKLDLPSDASTSSGCACGGECECGKRQ